jgi:hypothetical protein
VKNHLSKRQWLTRSARIGFTVAAAILLLDVALPGVAQAAYPGADGAIAFVNNGDIYTIQPSGSGLTLLAGDGADSGPRWSPNGQQIAYLDAGNLWIMNADGTGKSQITAGAPTVSDSRPSWSPDGQYLAFVQRNERVRYGDVMRYDVATGQLAAFTTQVDPPALIDVSALSAPVAWGQAYGPEPDAQLSYFLIVEGAGALCEAGDYCLDALGFASHSQLSDLYPSAEDFTTAPTRLTGPDWQPNDPPFGTGVLTNVESCPATGCTPSGLSMTIGSATILPGAYDGVYGPNGTSYAYVVTESGIPEIFSRATSNIGRPKEITAGTEPDWQPVSERSPVI